MPSLSIMSIFQNVEVDPEMSFSSGRQLSEVLVRNHRYHQMCPGDRFLSLYPMAGGGGETFESSHKEVSVKVPW